MTKSCSMTWEQTTPTVSGLPQATTKLLALCAIALVALTGCRSDEQDRIMSFEPGMYQGKQDAGLDQNTLDALRGRASLQGSP